jgi:hypothetical protein
MTVTCSCMCSLPPCALVFVDSLWIFTKFGVQRHKIYQVRVTLVVIRFPIVADVLFLALAFYEELER